MALGFGDKIKKLFGLTEEMEQEQSVYQPDWGKVDTSKGDESFEDVRARNVAARSKDNPNEFDFNKAKSDKTFVHGGNKPGAGGGGGGGRVSSR